MGTEDTNPYYRLFLQIPAADEVMAHLRRAEGTSPEESFYNIIGQPAFDEAGRVEGIIVLAVEASRDIAERRRREEAQRLLGRVSAALSSTLDLEATLSALPRLAVPDFADWCAIYKEQRPGGALALAAIAHADEAMAARIRDLCGGKSVQSLGTSGPYRRVFETGQAELCARVDVERLKALNCSDSMRELLLTLDARSWIIVPLMPGRRALGVITFGVRSQRRGYGPEDLALAEELGVRASIAIEHALLFEASQRERARAEELSRSKDEFLAMISHELRTPLTAILGWVSMLKSGLLPEEKWQRAVDTIERNAQAQQRLIEDLLDISCVERGKLRLNVRPVDPCDIVDGALEVVRPAAAAKRIQLLARFERSAGPILGDPEHLQRVFWSLLTNAMKFTPEGGRVEVSVRRDGAYIEVRVSDTGKGIRAELLPYVFERFWQADASITRVHGGLGLGLTIVRHLVELHGGTVDAASAGDGQGAVFTVRLPSLDARAS